MIRQLLTVSILALAAGVGCSTVNSTERSEPMGRPDVISDNRVVTDSSLGKYARIQSVNQSELPGGITKIQVALRNDSSFEQRIIYKFEWFDLDGMIVETPLSTWQAKTIQGKEQYVLTGVAPTPAAKDFRLKLQESKWN